VAHATTTALIRPGPVAERKPAVIERALARGGAAQTAHPTAMTVDELLDRLVTVRPTFVGQVRASSPGFEITPCGANTTRTPPVPTSTYGYR